MEKETAMNEEKLNKKENKKNIDGRNIIQM